METLIFIKISFFVIAVIAAIVNKKEEKEKISVLKQSNNTLSLMLRIVASVAFDQRRNIVIDNLSNREKTSYQLYVNLEMRLELKKKMILNYY